jgi:hypothetical protein
MLFTNYVLSYLQVLHYHIVPLFATGLEIFVHAYEPVLLDRQVQSMLHMSNFIKNAIKK